MVNLPTDVTLAYLDPVSGSVILQALIAGVLGAILSIKRVGWTVRDLFARLFRRRR